MNNKEPRTDKDARPPVGNLTDFVDGIDDKKHLHIEVAINDDGRVIVFYDKPWKQELSWFEYDTEQRRLSFIFQDGDIRDAGLPLEKTIAKHMHNTQQILTVLMDDETGEARDGHYVPLIIHQT